MLVGGGATCPNCLQTDTTQKVSLLVHQIEGDVTPAEYDSLVAAQGRGEVSDWQTPRQEDSWQALARKLQAPERPELPALAKTNTRSMRLLWTVGYFAAIALFFSIVPYLEGVAVFLTLIGVLLLPAVVGVFWARYAFKERKKYESTLATWGEAKAKWAKLYYCARDNKVFLPGQRRAVSPDQVRSFLFEES